MKKGVADRNCRGELAKTSRRNAHEVAKRSWKQEFQKTYIQKRSCHQELQKGRKNLQTGVPPKIANKSCTGQFPTGVATGCETGVAKRSWKKFCQALFGECLMGSSFLVVVFDGHFLPNSTMEPKLIFQKSKKSHTHIHTTHSYSQRLSQKTMAKMPKSKLHVVSGASDIYLCVPNWNSRLYSIRSAALKRCTCQQKYCRHHYCNSNSSSKTGNNHHQQ